jgi:hypothetical protein
LGTAVCFLSSQLWGQDIDFATARQDRKMVALRIDGEITLDGVLDEPQWSQAEPAKDFIQKLPATGEPATEPTEVRLLYDQDNLYVGVYCFDSAGPNGIVVNDITKDFFTLDSDGFQIIIDTYNDNRNAFLFGTNPEAGRFDMQIGSDGSAGNSTWDGVWFVETQINEDGWQVEMAIPFKTLRFKKIEEQVWGVNFERRVRRKFEDSYWSPLPPQFRLGRVSLAGQLDGIEGVQQGLNAYFKPYVKAPLLKREDDDVDFQPTIGLEVFKWAVTSQMTFDGTINTDFSQVEADDVRINLTRFNLFFPEKRDFFLENQAIFAWGRTERGPRGRPDLLPFHSRRIGLTEDGDIVPILAGARLTGRTGPYSIGLLNMQTGEFGEKPPEDSLDPQAGIDEEEEEDEYTPSTNFTVVRMRRDILRQSDFGGIFVNKHEVDGSYNRTYGFDSNFNFFSYLDINSYVVKTETPDLSGEDVAGNIQGGWNDGFFETRAGHLVIGENFNPEVGFAPRTGVRKSFGEFGITPRPREKIPWIREINPSIDVNYITNWEGELETREYDGRISVEFSESSRFSVSKEAVFERLEEDFEIRDGIVIAAGDYNFDELQFSFRSNRSKMISAEARYSTGGFWDGDRDGYEFGLVFRPTYKFSAGVEWNHNDIELPGGSFKTDLAVARIEYSISNNKWLNALIQYNGEDREVSSNIRFNWMFKPLSDLYLVYNERRTSEAVIERALILKVTYVLPL